MLKYITIALITALLTGITIYKIVPPVPEVLNLTCLENVGAPPIEEEPEPEIEPEFRTVEATADKYGVDFKTFNDWRDASNTATFISFEYKGIVLYDDFNHAGYVNCRNGMWGTSTPEFCDLKTTEQQKSGAMINKVEQYEAKLKQDSQIDYSGELKK